MIYKLYKLKFTSPVHFGNKTVSGTDNTFSADRLFSAFCVESANSGQADNIEVMVNGIKDGKFLISDSMPYIDDELYIPRPLIESRKQGIENLAFIPFNSLADYMSGRINVTEVQRKLSTMGSYKTNINCGEEIFLTGQYEFAENSGLYFVIGYEEDAEDLFYMFDDMMTVLGFIGIGGRLTYGCGKFENFGSEDLPKEYEELLTADGDKYVTLSISMANEEELKEIMDNCTYNIVTKGGYVVSNTYSDSKLKKSEMHLFTSGSIFGQKFKGDVYDVSQGKGNHPVWKYAKPIFLALK